MDINEYCQRNHLYKFDRKNYSLWVEIDDWLASVTGLPAGTRYYLSEHGRWVNSWAEFVHCKAGNEIRPSDSSKHTDLSRAAEEGP
jgi:hypothetical protein